ncbi:MAG: hypothetical protein JXB47_06635 [Anaerolineae bacterium]|nr:hypothetical protein [Anaerolineae bacterium]
MQKPVGLLIILTAAMLLSAACGSVRADVTATADAHATAEQRLTVEAVATRCPETCATLGSAATRDAAKLEEAGADAATLAAAHTEIAAGIDAQATAAADAMHAQATADAYMRATDTAKLLATQTAYARGVQVTVNAVYTSIATMAQRSTWDAHNLETWREGFMGTPPALMTQSAAMLMTQRAGAMMTVAPLIDRILTLEAQVTQEYALNRRIGALGTPLALTAWAQSTEIAGLKTQQGAMHYYPLFPTIEYIISYEVPPGVILTAAPSPPTYLPPTPPPIPTWTPWPTYSITPTYPALYTPTPLLTWTPWPMYSVTPTLYPTPSAAPPFTWTPTPGPNSMTSTAIAQLVLTNPAFTEAELQMTGTAWVSWSTLLAATQTAAWPSVTPTMPWPTFTLTPTVLPRRVIIVGADGVGDLQTEEVRLINGDGAVNLKDWTLCSNTGTCYTFPRVVLFPRMMVAVRTRSGEDSPAALYWGRDEAAWAPNSTIILRDAAGEVKSTWSTGG